MKVSQTGFSFRDLRRLSLCCLLISCLTGSFARGQITIALPDAQAVDNEEDALTEAPEERSHSRSGTPKKDRLSFLSGDLLSGEVLEIDGKQGLLFRHPDAEAPIRFALKNLHELQFAHEPVPETKETLMMAYLTNGNRISGKIKLLDGESLTLQTRYAGDVTLSRSVIQRILPSARDHLLYSGPGEKSDWVFANTNHSQNWTFENDSMKTMSSQGYVGRNFPDLPEKYMISMDMKWRGMPFFQYHLMALDPRNPHSGSWSLMIQGDNFRMYRQGGVGHMDLGNTQITGFSSRQSAKLSLGVDKKEKMIHLLVDDVSVHKWTDSAGFQAGGNSIIFNFQQAIPFEISNLTLSAWDGKIAEAGAPGEAADILELANGDRISGKLLGIEDQILKFQNDWTAFDLPLKRVNAIQLDETHHTVARLQENDVEARIFGGDQITLALEALSPDQLTGKSENFNGIQVKNTYLSALHFNLYDERKEAIQNKSEF